MSRDHRPQPFDGAAPSYDAEFSSTTLGRMQRERAWALLDRVLPPTGRVLDLGCGTGEDTRWLVQRGAERVVGCDASQAMLSEARRKLDADGLGDRVELCRIDLNRIAVEPMPPEAPFDAAISNFGAVNCVHDRRALAASVARWLSPGAPFVVVVMGRFCLWEIIAHLAQLRPGAAFRRWRQGREVGVPGGGRVRVWYPTTGDLRREFGPHFELRETIGVGAFLPPPYLDQLVRHRPRLLARLGRLETRFGDRRPWSRLADHVALVFARDG
ncbi:MAG: class I SAM-dependent methyltransferase [Holophagae bacterium]